MSSFINLTHPTTLDPDREYFWRQRTASGCAAVPVQVRFIQYDPCPAFVIVRTAAGRRARCLREELYNPGRDRPA